MDSTVPFTLRRRTDSFGRSGVYFRSTGESTKIARHAPKNSAGQTRPVTSPNAVNRPLTAMAASSLIE